MTIFWQSIRTIEENEIVSSLSQVNGTYFYIHDLYEYAKKVLTYGKSIEIRQEHTQKLISYILYYDNRTEKFLTMGWTHPEFQGQGLFKKLLKEIVHSTNKNIRFEVHKDNPSKKVTEELGFTTIYVSGNIHTMCLKTTIAVMQPYLFPYIGYFHLISASDLFVFLDDVYYKKRGWINRNRILVNNKDQLFTVPLSKPSQNKLIKDISIFIDHKWKEKFYKMLTLNYSKAPYFSSVMDLIYSVFSVPYRNISDLSINSIANIYDYLDLKFDYTRSSICSPETRGMEKADRLIELASRQGYDRYANLAGGRHLYSKEYFLNKGVELLFVNSDSIEYKQFSNKFVPWLSIIDILMFNDKNTIRNFFTKYKIE